jgi:hypothetical protein
MKTARQTQLLFTISLSILAGCTGSLDASQPDRDDMIELDPATALEAIRNGTRCRGRRCDGGTMLRADSGTMAQLDAGAPPTTSPDAGPIVMPTPDAGPPPPADAGSVTPPPPTTPCVRARRLWFEDFETGNYDRWTGRTYGNEWGNGCQSNRFDYTNVRSGRGSHRSEIVCRNSESHRGYGGIQFSGETVLSGYTNRGVGLEAPYGVVNTYWSWLDTPYDFGGGRWFSFWTVNSSCDYSERVITLGLEDATRRLTPAHIWDTGGRVTWSPGAPSFPLRRWVRTTLYVNYARGEMHAWQDGVSVFHATFSRPTRDMCQWHWGAYASGDNTDIVLYEDDMSLWKLEEPLTDFSVEPWFEGSTSACR